MTDLTVRGSLLDVQTQLRAISLLIKNRKARGWPIFQSDEEWKYETMKDGRECPTCKNYERQNRGILRGDEIPVIFPDYEYYLADPSTCYPRTHQPDISKFRGVACRCSMTWVNFIECIEARLHLEKLEVLGVG